LANRDSNSTHLCIQAFKKKHNHNLLNKSWMISSLQEEA
jgi:hypothetical protein